MLKSRDIILLTKACLVKAVVFPVVMYGCESWTIKKAEHWRIDVFELWCWRRLLRVPWTAMRSNQSVLKEISSEYSLEVLTHQYFGHLMRRTDSLEKTLMLGKIEGRRGGDDRGWEGWMASPTRWTWIWASSRIWWWTGKACVLQSMGSQRVGHTWVTELKYEKILLIYTQKPRFCHCLNSNGFRNIVNGSLIFLIKTPSLIFLVYLLENLLLCWGQLDSKATINNGHWSKNYCHWFVIDLNNNCWDQKRT